MNDVFISYSRRDKVFTQKLYEALTAANRTVWADWDSIPAASDWDAEIKQGIQETNSVLFVLSPEWIKSNECRKELVHAVAMGKRLFPILYLPVDPNEVPPELAKINWVYLRDSDDFDKGFQTLCSAMDTDLDWIKTHTRIQVRALEWEKKNRSASFALRGEDLTEGEQFIAGAANKSPIPTQLQSEYILASRKDATRRQRQTLAGVTVAMVISIVLGTIAFFQRHEAVTQKATAVAAEATAISAKETAVANEKEAKRQATISQSQLLAVNSTLDKDKPLQNLLLGIESFNMVKDYPYPDRILPEQALRDSLNQVNGLPLNSHEKGITTIAFSPDGQWLATGSYDNTVLLWNIKKPSTPPIFMRGHIESITTLAFSPNGQWLASGSNDSTARLWNMKNPPTQPIVLRGHNGGITTLSFSPDGQWLATGSWDTTVRLWNLKFPPSDPIILRGHKDRIFAIAFNPDGEWLATGSKDSTIRLWNMNDLSEDSIVLRGSDDDFILALAFSPHGQWLATSGYYSNIQLWNMQIPSADPIILHGNGLFSSLAFSPTGKWLAVNACENMENGSCILGAVHLWDVTNPTTEPIVLSGHEREVTTLAFSPDGEWLATGSYDDTARLWNMKKLSAKPIILRGHEGAIDILLFSPDSEWLATGSGDYTARLWNMKNIPSEPLVLRGHEGAILALTFSPNGQWLATGSNDSTARLWNIKDQFTEPMILQGDTELIFQIAFSPNGEMFATLSCNYNETDEFGLCLQGVISLWGAKNPSAKPIIRYSPDIYPSSIAFSSDGKWLALGACGSVTADSNSCTEGIVRMWNANDPSVEPILLHGNNSYISTLAFSPDGKWLATGSSDIRGNNTTVLLWNIKKTSVAPINLRGHDGQITSVAFSPDSEWLATGSIDATARLWNMNDLSTNSIVLRGHTKSISALAFSPNGEWLATSSLDTTARLWNMEKPSADPIILHGHEGAITSIAFSPNGEWLATGSIDSTVRLWSMKYGYLIEKACQVVGRSFTRAEWIKYFPNEEYRKTCEQWPLEQEVTTTPTATP